MRGLVFCFALASSFLVAANIDAVDFVVADNGELAAALGTASSGDRILLAPGQYNRFSHTGLNGVTLRSQDPNNLAVIDAGGSGEVMQLSSITNVTIEHLIFQNYASNGINIDDSGNWPNAKSSGVVIRDVIVRNSTAVSGNRDGIKLSGVDGFHIDRVQVINWSDGGSAIDPVGSHNGRIENSRFVHNGTTASGIRPKGGSSNIDILGNYMEMQGGRAIQFGGSTDSAFFRFLPGESGYEADEIRAAGNIVRGAESAFSWVNIDGGVARYNFIDNPDRWIIRILNENQGNSIVDTQNGIFSDNTVQFDDGLSRIVNIGPEVEANSFLFERNHWFNTQSPITAGDISLPSPEVDGIYGVDPNLNPLSPFAVETEWGVWIVNPHLDDQILTIDGFQNFQVATPGTDFSFDPLIANPFQGDWSFTNLTSSSFDIAAQSQVFLRITAVPEPHTIGLMMISAIGLIRRPTRRP